MASDSEIIRRCQGGETNAFNELVLRYQDRVYNTAYRFTGNTADAADIAQQTFINAFRAIAGFKGDSSVATWLHRITFNLFASDLRRAPRRRAASLDDEEANLLPAAVADDPAEADDNTRLVREILAAMDEGDRKLIVLKDIDGYKYREIAEMLGMPEGSVHGRIHRIRMALREKLKTLMENR